MQWLTIFHFRAHIDQIMCVTQHIQQLSKCYNIGGIYEKLVQVEDLKSKYVLLDLFVNLSPLDFSTVKVVEMMSGFPHYWKKFTNCNWWRRKTGTWCIVSKRFHYCIFRLCSWGRKWSLTSIINFHWKN